MIGNSETQDVLRLDWKQIGDIYRKVDHEVKTIEISNQIHRKKHFKLLQTLSRIGRKKRIYKHV